MGGASESVSIVLIISGAGSTAGTRVEPAEGRDDSLDQVVWQKDFKVKIPAS